MVAYWIGMRFVGLYCYIILSIIIFVCWFIISQEWYDISILTFSYILLFDNVVFALILYSNLNCSFLVHAQHLI